mmetsp:Transcript_51099/g.131789  ORF Transcript_51099/g.131789 Transcript_51099/m.131789 type:complete len:258 (-) Transcript_51099:280-1053(-)
MPAMVMAEAAVGVPPPMAGDCEAADVKCGDCRATEVRCGACNKEDGYYTTHYATLLQPHKLPAHSRYGTLLLERQKTLGSSDLRSQVKLPRGASEEEWLAVCTVDMFNELNLLAGAVSDLCTEKTCPVMSAGAYTFAWADGDKIKVPTKVSAPRYFEYLLSWVEKQLSDETFLPTQPGVAFPPTYRKGMRVIYKRLFRIYAHIFHAHFKEMMEQEADAHLNHSFKHFIYFVKEFNLVDDEELEPLKDLIALCMRQTH